MSQKTIIICISFVIVVASIAAGIVIGFRSSQPNEIPMVDSTSGSNSSDFLIFPPESYVTGRSKLMKDFQERIYQSSKEKR